MKGQDTHSSLEYRIEAANKSLHLTRGASAPLAGELSR